jgi:hypothetical protein
MFEGGAVNRKRAIVRAERNPRFRSTLRRYRGRVTAEPHHRFAVIGLAADEHRFVPGRHAARFGQPHGDRRRAENGAA